MRAWLSHPSKAYNVDVGKRLLDVVWKQVPTHAIEDGHADKIIAAAREFAAASPEDRRLSRTFLCELDGVARLTHGDAERRAKLMRIAELLLNSLKKEALEEGRLDPVAIRQRGPMVFVGW